MQTAIDFVARCLSGSALAALGGVKFVVLTDEEYKELDPKNPTTFYLVEKGNKTILYLGDATVSSGVTGGNTIIKTIANIGFAADMEVINSD